MMHALGWAAWKTYLGRPEESELRRCAFNMLGLGLFEANHLEDALSVQEAELAMRLRSGASEEMILGLQSNIADTYKHLGDHEKALSMDRDVYFGNVKLYGEEHEQTIRMALNYGTLLGQLNRFEEAKLLLRKFIPAARRVLGENHGRTLKIRWAYADALFGDPSATLDDLREAVATLEETERTARRVFGNSHPTVLDIGEDLKSSREALARLGEDSDKAAIMAIAFVAALAFFVGRRYLRR